MRYLEQFFSLKCAGDVLNAVAPVTNGAKEITEAMSAVRALKPIMLHEPMKYGLLDLCAGNALGSILAVHVLPVRWAVAVDKTPRARHHEIVKRFEYVEGDVTDLDSLDDARLRLHREGGARDLLLSAVPPFTILAIHACSGTAKRIVELYKLIPSAKALVMIPCCGGAMTGEGKALRLALPGKVTAYEAWCWELARMAGGSLRFDTGSQSPCNGVIVARKEAQA